MLQIPFINSYSGTVAKSLKEYKERKKLETHNAIVDNSFFPIQICFSLYSDDAICFQQSAILSVLQRNIRQIPVYDYRLPGN